MEKGYIVLKSTSSARAGGKTPPLQALIILIILSLSLSGRLSPNPLEVADTVPSRFDEILMELQHLEVSGKDVQFLRKALHHLQQARTGMTDTALQLLQNLFNTLQAVKNMTLLQQETLYSQ